MDDLQRVHAFKPLSMYEKQEHTILMSATAEILHVLKYCGLVIALNEQRGEERRGAHSWSQGARCKILLFSSSSNRNISSWGDISDIWFASENVWNAVDDDIVVVWLYMLHIPWHQQAGVHLLL